MIAQSRVLVIEDDASLLHVMQAQLSAYGYAVSSAPNAMIALDILANLPQELVITDLNLPHMSGVDLLQRIHARFHKVPVIVMTAFGTIQSAVNAMKAGAYDYVVKPIYSQDLRALVSRALEESKQSDRRVEYTSPEDNNGFEEIIGASSALADAIEVAKKVAPTDATVLIHGETGTGKELIANGIHRRSNRRHRPFATINCAAIPRDLLESELFGYLKGSFTGAISHKKGKVEMVDGGTLLLDEIGEMPLELQVRILRLIQEREIEKVGATSATKVDIRILAATHRDLSAMVKQGLFREDLYYRLLVVPIEVPPLRDRTGDIPSLVRFFLQRYKAKHSRPDLTMSDEILARFKGYSWPGNIRELEHVVERVVLLSRTKEVAVRDLPSFLWCDPEAEAAPSAELPKDGMSMRAVERDLILKVMSKCGGNQVKAAAYLGISRRTLGYRLKKYGFALGSFKKYQRAAV